VTDAVTAREGTVPAEGTPALSGPADPAGPAALVAAARSGDPRALARLISLVENASPQLRNVMRLIAPHTGGARVIGLTGAPGVGKSTITSALVGAYRGQGLRVGVLAVDPTSPFSGGALLGDRVRMQNHAADAGVFIRSMATRGHLGGLSWAAPQVLRVLDAAGFDVIMIETVGVGQAEVEVASAADSTLVIVAPGMGDSVQAAKAGILEIADIFVVNKNDRPGAQETIRDLRTMLAMAPPGPDGWKPPIVAATAAAGEGIDELVGRLAAHAEWLGASGERDRRRLARAREEVSAIAVASLRQQLSALPGQSQLELLAGRVARGELDPYTAADRLVGG
jgi:LAO/AO transport system kinase